MVKPICTDLLFLQRKSVEATEADRILFTDMYETLRAQPRMGECVGLAANMIGASKRVIAVGFKYFDMVMVNPEILETSGPYMAVESCPSLKGTRQVRRFEKITVRFLDTDFKEHTKTYTGPEAQIIQHECDHLEGRII